MNYLIYLVLVPLFICTVGPATPSLDLEKLQRLFDAMHRYLAECPKVKTGISFHTCPSHLWPEILQNFVPQAKVWGYGSDKESVLMMLFGII